VDGGTGLVVVDGRESVNLTAELKLDPVRGAQASVELAITLAPVAALRLTRQLVAMGVSNGWFTFADVTGA
jgi:hypothetical protein